MDNIEKLKLTYDYLFSKKTAAQVLREHNATVEKDILEEEKDDDLLTESKNTKHDKGFSVHVMCNCGSADLTVNEGTVECKKCNHKEILS